MSESTHCAVVTGPSRGIGQAIARRRAGVGWILNISSRQVGPRVGPPFARPAPAGADAS